MHILVFWRESTQRTDGHGSVPRAGGRSRRGCTQVIIIMVSLLLVVVEVVLVAVVVAAVVVVVVVAVEVVVVVVVVSLLLSLLFKRSPHRMRVVIPVSVKKTLLRKITPL